MIPKKFHFVFGLRPQVEPFHIVFYLCLKSCIEVNRLDTVYFHYKNEPHGPWWEKIKPALTLVKIEETESPVDQGLYDNHPEGAFIRQMGLEYAHQSDFIRLDILAKEGGVYCDMDTLFVQPYPEDMYQSKCLMGAERQELPQATLCNAVILAEKNSEFIRRWIERSQAVFDGTWNRHSCIEPAILGKEFPELIDIRSPVNFFHFPYSSNGLKALLGKVSELPKELYSIHLWSHLWWESERTDFLYFHAGLLTEQFINEHDTTFNLIARRFLD